MNGSLLLTVAILLLVAILGLVAYNLYLVFKLKDVKLFEKVNSNNINGILFLVFLVVGLTAAFLSSGTYSQFYHLITNPASDHGIKIDQMFWITAAITIFVFVVTNALLFGFSFQYRGKEKKKGKYYPENNRLEIIWTVIPAVVLTLLIARAIGTWHNINGPAPENAMEIELNAKQFAWTVRYPGSDNTFGDARVIYINENNGNELGFDFEDRNAHDDFIADTIHLIKGVPVKVNVKSRDVLHNASMPFFRMKMDAVPGMPTGYWFTPLYTTAEMREKKKNPEFNYELACQELCGGAHWNMRRVIVVDTQEEYDKWFQRQKAFYPQWAAQNGIEVDNIATTTASGNDEVSMIEQ